MGTLEKSSENHEFETVRKRFEKKPFGRRARSVRRARSSLSDTRVSRAPLLPPHVHTARPALRCCAPPQRFGGETSAKPSPPAAPPSARSRPSGPFQGLEAKATPGVRVGTRI